MDFVIHETDNGKKWSLEVQAINESMRARKTNGDLWRAEVCSVDVLTGN